MNQIIHHILEIVFTQEFLNLMSSFLIFKIYFADQSIHTNIDIQTHTVNQQDINKAHQILYQANQHRVLHKHQHRVRALVRWAGAQIVPTRRAQNLY